MFNKNSHQSVEGKSVFFQSPKVGDVVKAFNRPAVVSHDFSDSNERQPFVVVFCDEQGGEGMAFRNEMQVVAKRNDNWVASEVAEMNAQNVAQSAFAQFQIENW